MFCLFLKKSPSRALREGGMVAIGCILPIAPVAERFLAGSLYHLSRLFSTKTFWPMDDLASARSLFDALDRSDSSISKLAVRVFSSGLSIPFMVGVTLSTERFLAGINPAAVDLVELAVRREYVVYPLSATTHFFHLNGSIVSVSPAVGGVVGVRLCVWCASIEIHASSGLMEYLFS